MTLPRDTSDFKWRGIDYAAVRGQGNIRYYDAEMKEGEVSLPDDTTIEPVNTSP